MQYGLPLFLAIPKTIGKVCVLPGNGLIYLGRRLIISSKVLKTSKTDQKMRGLVRGLGYFCLGGGVLFGATCATLGGVKTFQAISSSSLTRLVAIPLGFLGQGVVTYAGFETIHTSLKMDF